MGLVLVDRWQILQLRQDFAGGEGEALLGFGMGYEPLPGHHDNVVDAADARAEFFDLLYDGIRVTGEHLAL